MALDENNSLCVIELKYKRDNEVKEQTIVFESIVNQKTELFKNLIFLFSQKEWNLKTRKIIVWPKAKGIERINNYKNIEEIKYTKVDNINDYKFEV